MTINDFKRLINSSISVTFLTVQFYARPRQDTDPAEADAGRPEMAAHLRGIDQLLADALAMLNRVPRTRAKILTQIRESAAFL